MNTSSDRVPPGWSYRLFRAVRALDWTALDSMLGMDGHFRDGVMSGSLGFVSADMDDPLAVCMATAGKGLSLQVRHGYLGCPVNVRDGAAPAWLAVWARLHGSQHIVEAPLFGHVGEARSHEDMAEAEEAARTLTAYMWLSMRFPDSYPEGEAATWARMRLNGIIEDALSDRVSSRKKGKRHKSPIP